MTYCMAQHDMTVQLQGGAREALGKRTSSLRSHALTLVAEGRIH
jgi:hypothetical protein